jgi:hypothetical protein
MMPMPAYINYWGLNDIRPNTPPVSEGSLDLANSLFGTFTEVDFRMSSPKLVCFYAGKPSEHLDMRDNPDVRFQGDTFSLVRQDNPLLDKLIDKKNWSMTNKVVGFNVDFGNRNQSMFYNIQLDQNSFASTTEANKATTEMVNATGGRKSFNQNVGLYNLYKNRSYECTIESLGNAMIQPTMYFNLRHVPMFNGPYMIQSVTHNIDAGSFRTTFKGVRMPTYSLPKITDQIASINQNIIDNLVNQIQRRRQDEQISGVASNNITTVGGGINTLGKYTPKSSSTCFSSLSPAYSTYVGTESVPVQINYKQTADIISSLTEDTRVRACVFYTMYLNGIKDELFYGYNYNMGGVPAGGYLYSDIKYGGSLNSFFNRTYYCMDDGSGNVRPYMSFNDFNSFINFAVSYYKNKVAEYATFWNQGSVVYEGYPPTLAVIYSRYWPIDRFKTKEESAKWADNNGSTLTTLTEKGTEAVRIMRNIGLL